jgi:phosphinothricin acetyltransferase
MTEDDWRDVRAIYKESLGEGDATFETEAPDWQQWNAGHLDECRLVARSNGQIVGWAALCPVSSRQAYCGVAEVSVYVRLSAKRAGVGRALLRSVIDASERVGIWTLQASVFPENTASLALHTACGFREVGYRERIGLAGGVWRDTILLERRSRSVGVGDSA